MIRYHLLIHRWRTRLAVASLCSAWSLLFSTDSAAAVLLSGTATFNVTTSLYDYSYSVVNSEMSNVVLVTIPAASTAAILGIQAPVGFSLTFDPSQGWVNLNEDNDISTDNSFSPNTTVGQFKFSSAVAPQMALYHAFDEMGTDFPGLVLSPVPEPATAGLAASAALLGLARRRRLGSITS